MTVIRVAWLVLALATGVLGSFVAAWPLYQITDCELGLSLPVSECSKPIGEHFGSAAMVVLAVPVVLCLLPAARPVPVVAWSVAGLMFASSVVSLWTAFTSSSPTLLSLLGNPPCAVLALVLAALGSAYQRAAA
ncbi:hypothetical protein [Rhodococcoides yunnanense]|uniref:hypothetical protein n=1 Tax=Rhodococcoides yunnanense TaxID=278209 RepID=UPI00093326DC|nr:hypothetical protein [Rhodococcus yunnanensis]